MPVISVEIIKTIDEREMQKTTKEKQRETKRGKRIMKTIDEREMQKTTKENQTKTERSKGNRSYSERVRAKWFCCAFKSGFLPLMCKASLIFKSSLELALSIILKQRELYE